MAKAQIIRAKTFRDWFNANLKDSARDIAEYGAAGGFPGLIYYSDTVKLYDKFEDELWEMIEDDAREYGNENPLEFLASLNGAKQVGSGDTFKNMIVWYAAEKIAREISEKQERRRA